MTLFLRALTCQRFVKLPARRAARKLQVEPLEGRCVLSTLSALDPCSSAPLVEAEGAPQVQATETLASVDSGDASMPIGPLELDAYFASLGNQLVLPEGEEIPAPPPPGSTPPTITSFRAERDANFWIITGTVSDDEPIGGGQIVFGLYLEGESVFIQLDGTFEFYAPAAPRDIEAHVSAVAIDLDGLQSDPAYTILPG